MSNTSLESLKEQLASTEQELEQARAHVYRCDGALQLLRHLISQAEAPESAPSPEDTSN